MCIRDRSIAGVLAVQAWLSRIRRRDPNEIPNTLRASVEWASLMGALNTILAAMKALDEDRQQDCLELLGGLSRRIPNEIAAEADYIRARALMETRSEVDRHSALELLRSWDELEESEHELSTRLQMQQLYALSMEMDKTDGLSLERRITRRLQRRIAIDRTAEDAIARLERTSPSLHPPGIAMPQVRDAAIHFGDSSEGLPVRQPVELYKSLVTLVAQEIANARYSDAVVTAGRLGALIGRYPERSFPRADFARSNMVLAQFRNGDIDERAAAAAQNELVESGSSVDDPFYPQSNLAIFLALNGEIPRALAIVSELQALLKGRALPEPSMSYLLAANETCLRYCQDPTQVSLESWDVLGEEIERIPYPAKDAYVDRHRLLRAIFESEELLHPMQFDGRIHELSPTLHGPLWDHIGHGFWLTAVELWH